MVHDEAVVQIQEGFLGKALNLLHSRRHSGTHTQFIKSTSGGADVPINITLTSKR